MKLPHTVEIATGVPKKVGAGVTKGLREKTLVFIKNSLTGIQS